MVFIFRYFFFFVYLAAAFRIFYYRRVRTFLARAVQTKPYSIDLSQKTKIG